MNLSVIFQAIILGLAFGGIYALIASGLTMVYAVTRHVNIAHGDFLALTMYGGFAIYSVFFLDPYVSAAITIPVMCGLGLLVFHFLVRPLLHAHPIMVLQLFFAVMFIIESTLHLVFTGTPRNIPSFLDLARISLGPVIITVPQLVAFLVSTVLCASLYLVIRLTNFGRNIRAVVENPPVASLTGIKVRQVQMLVFALGFALLGVAGPLVAPMVTLTPKMGLNFSLFAIIIMMLGGMGNFVGTLVAAFIIGMAQAIGTLVLVSGLASAIAYACFVFVLAVKPRGLFGTR